MQHFWHIVCCGKNLLEVESSVFIFLSIPRIHGSVGAGHNLISSSLCLCAHSHSVSLENLVLQGALRSWQWGRVAAHSGDTSSWKPAPSQSADRFGWFPCVWQALAPASVCGGSGVAWRAETEHLWWVSQSLSVPLFLLLFEAEELQDQVKLHLQWLHLLSKQTVFVHRFWGLFWKKLTSF